MSNSRAVDIIAPQLCETKKNVVNVLSLTGDNTTLTSVGITWHTYADGKFHSDQPKVRDGIFRTES